MFKHFIATGTIAIASIVFIASGPTFAQDSPSFFNCERLEDDQWLMVEVVTDDTALNVRAIPNTTSASHVVGTVENSSGLTSYARYLCVNYEGAISIWHQIDQRFSPGEGISGYVHTDYVRSRGYRALYSDGVFDFDMEALQYD